MTLDTFFARSIRRSYLRRLQDELRAETKARQRHRDRNALLSIDTPRSFRKSCKRYRQRLGSLLLVAEVSIDANSRQGWVGFLLEPVLDTSQPGPSGGLRVCARTLLRPGGASDLVIKATFSAHAVDRIIQRSGLVHLPLGKPDIEAINAEFSEALPFIPPALRAFNSLEEPEAARLRIILPARHGFFLGCRDETNGWLIIKTYVDRERLRSNQSKALAALGRICEAQLYVQAFSALFPDWINANSDAFDLALIEIWRVFGSRLAEECVELGLSDEAWASRFQDEPPQDKAA